MNLTYLPIKELVKKYPLSDFQIRRLEKLGMLRFQRVIIQARCKDGSVRAWHVKIIWEGDVRDFISGVALTWISVGKAAMIFDVTENAVRYWLNNGLVRYKKEAQYLVCKEDCQSYHKARLPICPRKKKQS